MMPDRGLISIIIPFYNGCSFVDSCVASLMKQTYPHFEAIFIDDGSTDDTAKQIMQYNDKRFVLLHQEKRGVSAARNVGLNHATGKYIAFMDIDDELEQDFLLSQVTAADMHNADVVLSNYVKVFPDGREERPKLPWDNHLLTKEEVLDRLIPESIWKKDGAIMGAIWRCMMSRTFWDKNKIYFNENVTIAEDLLFLLALYNRSERIYINSEFLYRYLVRQSSTVNSFRLGSLEKNLQFHGIFVNTLKTEGMYEKNISRYQSNKAAMYTAELSNYSRNPQLFQSRVLVRKLREELVKEPFDWRDCDLSKGRLLSLWMLEHKMYSLLLILYRVKEWGRLRKQ